MSENKYDVIVIGGGMAGAHAAYPLVEAGVNVAMIDGGIISEVNLENDFPENFEEIRRERKDQYKLFLGDDLRGLVADGKQSHIAAMTRGNREYIVKETSTSLPISSQNKDIEVLQSLAKGGLSEAWGAACDILDEGELRAIGVPADNMHTHYQEVIDRIGVSGVLKGFSTQSPLSIDSNAQELLDTYTHSHSLQQSDFLLKHPSLAVLSEKLGDRDAMAYHDLEYHLNRGNSIYRVKFTIDEMQHKNNFRYLPGRVVTQIDKKDNGYEVIVERFDGENREKEVYSTKNIICAAGAVNTVRILLKSLGLYNTRVPFITKTHFLIPCLQWKRIAKKSDVKRYSMCQLFLEHKKRYRGLVRSSTQLYTYKSLMLYKLLNYTPFAAPESMALLAMFVPSLILLDIRFPNFQSDKNTMYLEKSERKDILIIDAQEAPEEIAAYKNELRDTKKFLRKLGLLPLKVAKTALGSVAHYAGGISTDVDSSYPMHVNTNGELIEMPGVYVADASTWQALPARAPSLTIMANANRIGKEVLKNCK